MYLSHLNTAISELSQDTQYGYTASASQEVDGIKFVRITDLKDGKINWDTVPYCKCDSPDQYMLEVGDILFARTGATTGKTHLVRESPKAVFASYLIRLRPQKNILADYLYYFFQSDTYWKQIIEEKEGSAQPNVNGKKLIKINIPLVPYELQVAISSFLAAVRLRQDGILQDLPELPPPLEEQRRIVERIEELETAIGEARRLRQQSLEEIDILASQFTGSIINKDYDRIVLDRVCSLITDGTHQTPTYIHSEYVFLSAKNIKPFRFMPEQYRTVSHEDYKACLNRAKPQYGDVLLTRVGAGIGEAAMIDRDIEFAFYVSLALLRPIENLIIPQFLVHWLNSSEGRDYSRQQTLGKGHSQGNLNLKLLRQFQIPLPPLSEQRRIVAYLDDLQTKIDSLKRLQAETAAELDALLPSILDKAFKGEL